MNRPFLQTKGIFVRSVFDKAFQLLYVYTVG